MYTFIHSCVCVCACVCSYCIYSCAYNYIYLCLPRLHGSFERRWSFRVKGMPVRPYCIFTYLHISSYIFFLCICICICTRVNPVSLYISIHSCVCACVSADYFYRFAYSFVYIFVYLGCTAPSNDGGLFDLKGCRYGRTSIYINTYSYICIPSCLLVYACLIISIYVPIYSLYIFIFLGCTAPSNDRGLFGLTLRVNPTPVYSYIFIYIHIFISVCVCVQLHGSFERRVNPRSSRAVGMPVMPRYAYTFACIHTDSISLPSRLSLRNRTPLLHTHADAPRQLRRRRDL